MFEFKPMNPNRETTMAIIVFVLLLGCSLVPFLSAATLWLFPFPLIAMAVLQPRIYASTMALLAGLVAGIAGFGWLALFFTLALYFLSWAGKDHIDHDRSPFLTVVTITLVFVMLELVFLAFIHWSGLDIMSTMKVAFTQSLQSDKTLLKQMGYDSTTLANQTFAWVQTVFPGLVALLALVGAMVNVWLLKWILHSRVSIPPLLRNWRLPYSVLLVYLLSIALILVHAFHAAPLVWQTIQNIEVIGSFLIGVQGIAFIWRLVQPLKIRVIVLIAALLAATIVFISLLYIVFGVIDILNTTRLRRKT